MTLLEFINENASGLAGLCFAAMILTAMVTAHFIDTKYSQEKNDD